MNRYRKCATDTHGVLLSYKEEWYYVTCRKMNRTGDFHAKQHKPDSKDKHYMLSLICGI
jgi:hypothetical protein